MVGNVVYHDKP